MGYVEGRNLAVEYRAADNQEDRLAALARDLVQRRVDAIAVFAGQSIVAAKAATTSIPIIFFTGFDPVASGFVASLNRPGGNATGITVLNTEVLAKRLELLRELVPTAKSIGFLYSPTNLVSGLDRIQKDMETAADALGVNCCSSRRGAPMISRKLLQRLQLRRRTRCWFLLTPSCSQTAKRLLVWQLDKRYPQYIQFGNLPQMADW